VAAAADMLGAPVEHLDAAERAGLVRIGEGQLRFGHPLVRLAVDQSASAGERGAAHRALAGVLTEAGSVDRAAWHLAAATVEPDETVADALEDAAERARARGGFEAARAALMRAAELTAEPVPRCRRTVAAAENAWLAGQFTRVAGLLDAARPPASEPLLRATTGQLRGWLELSFGSVDVAQRVLVQAARDAAMVEVRLARSILAAAAEAAWLNSDRRAGAELRQVAATLPAARDANELHLDRVIEGFLCFLDGELTEAVDLLTTTVRRAERLGEPGLLILAAHHALYVGDDNAAYRLNTALVARARGLGAAADLQFALPRLVQAELLTGRWTAAAASAAEAVRLARAIGQPALTAFPAAWLALLAALQGDEENLWARIDDIDEVTAGRSLGIFQAAIDEIVRWARAVHSAAKGRYASAVAVLETLSHPVISIRAATDRIEAAVRGGRREQAQRWLGELEAFAQHSGAAWARAEVAHGHGLLSEGQVAASRFAEALARHEQAGRPFERARTELAYGELLRRARRRGEARAHLDAALQAFEDLGAGPWVERARVELRACGQTPRRRDPSTLRQLTPQELQVARFVARGLPNREVAAQLFLSPRTVDFHLRNVFTKLGISSRTELARLPLE
jgi:DNA-binding CsgD family transcriptional regulator